MSKLAASSSGAAGAQLCQASTTAAARACGQGRWKTVAVGAGTVLNTRDVTTPKLPPPAPRSAQNRSPWWFSPHPAMRTVREDHLRPEEVIRSQPVLAAQDS